MTLKTLSMIVIGALASSGLSAQTKAPDSQAAPKAVGVPGQPGLGQPGTRVSGTMKCGKSTRNAVEVGDDASHALAIVKTPCTWTRPMTIAGSDTKEGVSSALSDVRGDVSADHGYHVGTMASGDKYFVRFDGQTKSSQGVLQGQVGRWGFTGGTGKLAGLQGRGTYKSTGSADGTAVVEVEGEYRMGEPAKAAPPK